MLFLTQFWLKLVRSITLGASSFKKSFLLVQWGLPWTFAQRQGSSWTPEALYLPLHCISKTNRNLLKGFRICLKHLNLRRTSLSTSYEVLWGPCGPHILLKKEIPPFSTQKKGRETLSLVDLARSTSGVCLDPLTFMKDSSLKVRGSMRTPKVLRGGIIFSP